MNATTRNTIIGVILLLIVIALVAIYRPDGFSSAANENAARAVVVNFGAHLKDVSLLASDAKNEIAAAYSPYATADLLSAWEQDPQRAPGRLTSSPYPDRIEIATITPQGAGYIVQGTIVLMSSANASTTGNSGTVPVVIQVVKTADGSWKIAGYQEQVTGQ